ncbi:MAG TPA: sulfite exporter TauE/SafE family protein [Jatrophihabitans sp.]|uniref:sulfite exporter TauE/SafE family protein n=1 Tax=Jatrophihabitans sp. TaxID=1932789 RepID=UPI002DF9F144|nr:sulfite exporter TauE/SafE family protein [Jatrophihabitans sp.]
MTVWQGLLVLVAGVWAGTINTVVGSGTLVSFPVLLGIGLPPVTANVSNTVGLFPGSFTGAWGYRRELAGQRRRALVLGVASAVGAIIGAVLLLELPAGAFKAIVPVLIVLALLLVLFGARITCWLATRGHGATEHVGLALWLVVLGTGVYGGYFGAAQGVLLMGFLGLFLAESLQRQNALKNVLAGVVNFVAAIVFIATTHVDWAAAALIAVGSIIGGLLGARIGRRLPPTVLRATIVVVGLAAIVKLLL